MHNAVSHQAKPTKITTNPQTMAVHSDASYLNEEAARSRIDGHHFLSENTPFPPNNGAIHNVAEIIKGVMSSVAEAKLGTMYYINACRALMNELY